MTIQLQGQHIPQRQTLYQIIVGHSHNLPDYHPPQKNHQPAQPDFLRGNTTSTKQGVWMFQRRGNMGHLHDIPPLPTFA
jgi:hypothetical protein